MSEETFETFPLPDIPVRWHIHEDRIAVITQRVAGDSPIADFPCLACGEPLADGEPVALLALGPGADPEEREKARTLRWFKARGIALHAACAGV